MKRTLLILATLAFAALASPAEASNKFWVGGTGTWDSVTTTHWSASSGGGGGVAPPGSTDVAIFDGSSGGGTVTVDSSVSGATISGLTTSAFTGTLDFSAISAFTIGASTWVDAATGSHTITMGNGSFTFPGTAGNPVLLTASANLTLNAASSTFVLAPSSSATNARTFNFGGKTLGTVSVDGTNQNGQSTVIAGTPTITNLQMSNGAAVVFTSGTTTVSNAFTIAGNSATPFLFQGAAGTLPVIALPAGCTMTWAYVAHLSFSGNNLVATSSFNGGGNSGLTISAPSGGGGGGRIIGG